MSGLVLGVGGDEQPGRTLRAYAHCARSNCSAAGMGCVAVALVNIAPIAASIDLQIGNSSSKGRRFVYQISTVEQTFTGHRTTLNGKELLMEGAKLPLMSPVVEEMAGPMTMPALSVAFVVLPDAQVPACTGSIDTMHS